MKNLINDLLKKAGQIKQAVNETRIETIEEIGTKAQSYAPVRTGHLRDSKETEHQDNSSGVGFTADYAAIVNYGSVNQSANPFFTVATHEGEKIFTQKLDEKSKDILK